MIVFPWRVQVVALPPPPPRDGTVYMPRLLLVTMVFSADAYSVVAVLFVAFFLAFGIARMKEAFADALVYLGSLKDI